MAWTIQIIGGEHMNYASYMEILIDSADDITASDFPQCAPGSEAYNVDMSIYYKKKNDGTWVSIA